MQLPPFGIYILAFDKFHRVTASDGHEFIDCIQFLPPRFAIKSTNFHFNVPPLLSTPVERTFH